MLIQESSIVRIVCQFREIFDVGTAAAFTFPVPARGKGKRRGVKGVRKGCNRGRESERDRGKNSRSARWLVLSFPVQLQFHLGQIFFGFPAAPRSTGLEGHGQGVVAGVDYRGVVHGVSSRAIWPNGDALRDFFAALECPNCSLLEVMLKCASFFSVSHAESRRMDATALWQAFWHRFSTRFDSFLSFVFLFLRVFSFVSFNPNGNTLMQRAIVQVLYRVVIMHRDWQ